MERQKLFKRGDVVRLTGSYKNLKLEIPPGERTDIFIVRKRTSPGAPGLLLDSVPSGKRVVGAMWNDDNKRLGEWGHYPFESVEPFLEAAVRAIMKRKYGRRKTHTSSAG